MQLPTIHEEELFYCSVFHSFHSQYAIWIRQCWLIYSTFITGICDNNSAQNWVAHDWYSILNGIRADGGEERRGEERRGEERRGEERLPLWWSGKMIRQGDLRPFCAGWHGNSCCHYWLISLQWCRHATYVLGLLMEQVNMWKIQIHVFCVCVIVCIDARAHTHTHTQSETVRSGDSVSSAVGLTHLICLMK